MRIGDHFIKSWSKNQSTIALSSAEAELYAIIKTASESLGIMSILWDWSIPMEGDLMADASAALGIIGRSGLGKLRHIDTSYLWLQQESVKKKLKMLKVLGTENPADMMTKGLNIESITKFVRMLSMKHQEGRADLAPELNQALNKMKCVRFNSEDQRITKVSRSIKKVPKVESNNIAAITTRPIVCTYTKYEEFACPCPQMCSCGDIPYACSFVPVSVH